MKFFAPLAALAALASAAPAVEKLGNKGLDVKLQMQGNTEIKAIVKNTGSKDLKLMQLGSLLGKVETQKVFVSSNADAPDFIGAYIHIDPKGLDDTSFVTIGAGETMESIFDAAKTYDLSKGGEFSFQSNGTFSIADAEGKIVDLALYESNVVKTKVDGAKAASILAAHNEKRTLVQDDCQGSRRYHLDVALNNAHTMAQYAARQARYGPADRLNEYFKRSDGDARNIVAGVFDRSADHAATINEGDVKSFCTDTHEGCAGGGAVAVTYGGREIVYCNYFFDQSEELYKGCHGQDRPSVVIHESTHLSKVKGTNDNAYFYDGITRLNSDQALNNADTYALYAHSFYEDCYGASVAQVYVCHDSNFQGECVGIQMPVGFCAGVPNRFNDQISSLGGSYTGVCRGYKDAFCQGDSFSIPNGHDAQLNVLPDGFNDQLSSFSC